MSARRLARGAVAVALGGACAISAAGAADWYFDPVITASIAHNTNATSSATNQGDDLATGDFRLTLTGATPRTKTVFLLEPVIERYRDNTALNNISAVTGMTWTHDASTLTHWNGSLGWNHWERVRLLLDNPQSNQTTPRAKYDNFGGNFGGNFTLTPRSRADFGVAAHHTKYSNTFVNIEGTLYEVEPTNQYDAFIGLMHSFTPLTSMRLELRGSRLDEGLYGKHDIGRAILSWTHGAVERWQLRIAAGGAQDKTKEAGTLGMTGNPSEAVGSITLSARVGLRGDLTAGVNRDISGTGGTLGDARVDSAYLGWRQPVGVNSSIALIANASRFTPYSEALGGRKTDTNAFQGEWAIAFNPQWYLVIAAQHVDTTSDFVVFKVGDVYETPLGTKVKYNLLQVGMRWAPTARGGI